MQQTFAEAVERLGLAAGRYHTTATKASVRVCPECRQPILDSNRTNHRDGCSHAEESSIERDWRAVWR